MKAIGLYTKHSIDTQKYLISKDALGKMTMSYDYSQTFHHNP